MRFSAPRATLATLAIALTAASSAHAMSSTTPADGTGHPATVALLRSDGYWARPFCSGSLISGRVVATASHCVSAARGMIAVGWTIKVSNDPSFAKDENGWFTVDSVTTLRDASELILEPAYDPKQEYNHDVSAVVLSAPIVVAAADLPVLPPMGILDQLQADGVLRNSIFSVMGYGSDIKPKGRPNYTPSSVRRIGQFGFDALDKRLIHESMRVKTGSDAACYGDSGGPSLLQIGASSVLVGVTSSGDTPCYATNTATRTDTDEALQLLVGAMVANPD